MTEQNQKMRVVSRISTYTSAIPLEPASLRAWNQEREIVVTVEGAGKEMNWRRWWKPVGQTGSPGQYCGK